MPAESRASGNGAFRYSARTCADQFGRFNQHCAYAGPYLLAIADGTGPGTAGQAASSAVISAIIPLDADPAGTDALAAFRDAVAAANAALRAGLAADPALAGARSTLTAMRWSRDGLSFCHLGNSRGYLLRAGILYQFTHDHTPARELADQGEGSDDRPDDPELHRSLRAVDGRSDPDPDLVLIRGQIGDRFLLCSRGLAAAIEDSLILGILAGSAGPDDAAGRLIDSAIADGGPGTITCIVADYLGGPDNPRATGRH